MELRKMQLKSLKRVYKKERRRKVSPWKTMAILCLVLSLVFAPVCVAAVALDNGVAAILGGSFWELKNQDPNANYFALDFASEQELSDYAAGVRSNIQSEGTVLLMNNGALPLAAGSKVSTLSVNSLDLIGNGKKETMKTALEDSGFSVNPALWDFYCNEDNGIFDWLPEVLQSNEPAEEVPVGEFTQEVTDSFGAYGDAVIITLSRSADRKDLILDPTEKDLMAFAASLKVSGKVNKIVVLLNTSNPLQMDFLKENPYAIDACMWIGNMSQGGICVVADILAGKVNPSGSLTDTYCYDNQSAPAAQSPASVYMGSENRTYQIYREGIYVGYKYYETRYEDYVMGTGNAGKYTYSDNVAFSFGHGLSYTSFDYSDLQVSYDKETDRFVMNVTVTNTGSLAGKETVQVYVQSPYTQYDMDKRVEKPSVSLCGFGKTQLLEPGKSETVTIYVDKRSMTSYDAYGAGTYILDAGDYYLTVATDAHSAVNNILATKGYTVENTNGRMDRDGNKSMTYLFTQKELDAKTYAKSINATPVKNRLFGADINLSAETQQKITYLSRRNWEGTWPEGLQIELTDAMALSLESNQYNPGMLESEEIPVLGAKNGRKLFELMGLDYDDPMWDQLLDQLTFEDMLSLIADAYYHRMPVQSVQAPGVRYEGMEDTTSGLLAATFNLQLAGEAGKVAGNKALMEEVTGLYGPDCSVRRTSGDKGVEDSFLAGEMVAAQVDDIREKGIEVALTGFVFQGDGQSIWLNEQTAREIYLKAFQKALETEETVGVLINSVRWGTSAIEAYTPVLTQILQQEWGNRGVYILDVAAEVHSGGADGIIAGVTAYNALLWHTKQSLSGYAQDAAVITAMREACHRNLYALVNSAAMNGIGSNTTVKVTGLLLIKIMQIVLVALILAFVFCSVHWNRAWRRLRKTQAYLNYRTIVQTIKDEKKQK